MPNCISCGRQLPSPNEPHNICPECRAAIMARSPSSALPRPRTSIAFERMPLTTAIVGANVLVFLAMVLTGSSPIEPTVADVAKWGATTGFHTLLAQPWRMLTSNYVHIGILHIGFNMWCLWYLGALAERVFDRWTYFLTYTACGLAGSLVSVGLHPVEVGAGASGAIFGLAGALIAALYLGHLPVHPRALKATLKSLVLFAVYNLFFGAVVPGIDNSAHMGGLITGLGLGAVLAPRLTGPPDERKAWERWVFLAAAVVLSAVYYLLRQRALQYAYQPVTH
jgi:membrane associated rhomboid family serine protease